MIDALRNGPPVSPGTTAIAIACGMFLAFVAVDSAGTVRPLALPFLVLVPGLALVRAAGLRTSAASLSLAVGLSVGLAGAVGTVLVVVGRFDALLAAVLVVAVTLAGLLADESLRRVRSAVGTGTLDRAPADGAGTQQEPSV